MNAGGRIRTLNVDKKLVSLLLMLIGGAVLIVLSLNTTQTPQAEDITYTQGSVEQRLAHVLSLIEGAGDVEVLVTQSDTGVIGVLIVADGAQELAVRTELMRAAMTALDVPAQSVEVFARKKEVME